MYPQYPQNQRTHYEYSMSPDDTYFQRERFNHAHDALERAIVLFGSGLTTLLGLRFAFALLDANSENGIVSFVNGFTNPFVEPFQGLLSYDHASVGVVSFQGYTLLAMLGYGLLTAGLSRLVTITRY